MNRWSYSRLQTYAACPLQFRLKYVDREEGTTSAAATRGTLVHEFAELYARHCHATRAETDWTAGRELLASYPPEVREIGERYIESTSFDWTLTVAAGQSVEREFEVSLPDGLGIFRGRADLVLWNEYEGGLVVIDYKSGWGPRQKPEECPPQLQCYAWAMAQTFAEVQSIRAIYRYLGNGRDYSWDLWDPEPAWAVSLVRRINADTEFRATPGDACEWCDHTHCCPLATADPLTALTTHEEAQEALRQQLAMDARNKRLRAALNKWTAAHGAVEADGWLADKQVPKCVEESAPGEFFYTDRLALRNGASLEDVVKQLRAAGATEEEARSVVVPAALDGQAAMKLLAAYEVEEDPFGHDETDPIAEALRDLFAPAPWTGSLRFDIRKVTTSGEEGEE